MPKPSDPIDTLLSQMTLEQKVGQRFMTWIPGTVNSARAAALVRMAHIGGVIINEDTVLSYSQLKKLVDNLQNMAPHPLLFHCS